MDRDHTAPSPSYTASPSSSQSSIGNDSEGTTLLYRPPLGARAPPLPALLGTPTRGGDVDLDATPMLTPNRIHSPGGMSTYPSFISSVDSPSASVALLRANETLESLSRQLTELDHSRLLESDPDLTTRCCCGALSDCPTLNARDRVDAKLKLCGEIGTALLQRYEALEQKYHRAEKQLEIKRKALADSLRHVANLERANATHLSKYAEQSRAYEALEKRFTQVSHSQNLTQQALAQVRNELARSRATSNAQSVSLASVGRPPFGDEPASGEEDRLSDAERRFEDARTLYHAESRRLREELKWRQMAEERIADLEAKLTAAGREVEDIKAARKKDAQDLLANAKERLETLHAELSETFTAEHPSDTPEYLRTLEDLVATNALLKHDTSELARTLSHTLEENRVLKDEIDELRVAPRRPSSRPLSTELRPLLMRGHGHRQTISVSSNPGPAADSSRHLGHQRVASAAMSRPTNWSHRRNSSIAPSFTSTSTTTDPGAVTSPSMGLGFNPLGGDSPLARIDSGGDPLSPESHTTRARSSSGGIGYVHNGIPKPGAGESARWKRTRPRVSIDTRRSLTMRALGVEPLNEDELDHSNSEEAHSVHSADDSMTSESSRKRQSVFLPGVQTSPRLQFDREFNDSSASFDLPPYPHSDGASPHDPKQRVGRRTLLLLSKSMGVQTDPIPEAAEPQASPRKQPLRQASPSPTKDKGRMDSPAPSMTPVERSEASSMHERTLSLSQSLNTTDMSVGHLVEFLTKVLTKLRGVDIPTLNRRLKKQNLPSDVGHLSRTTISGLQSEIASMRHRFRGLLDHTSVTRRDLGLLLTLLRDVFTQLLDLQLTVNNVTLDPKLAKKLRREAFEDEKEAEDSTGFWGIAAPITNYFLPATASAATQRPADPPPSSSPSKRARRSEGRAAPKLPASTVASTASVTVEFGGAGVRRAAPASPKKSRIGVQAGSDVFIEEPGTVTQRSVSAPMPAALATTPSTASNADSLRVRSRASRSDLLGIFAGAQGAVPPRVRHTSSQIFADVSGTNAANSGSVRRGAGTERPRLSTIVDAVLDPPESALDDEDGPLLERTLRPRGLSDSSIHSTALLVPVTGITRGGIPLSPSPVTAALPVPARAVAIVTQTVDANVASGMLGNLTRRIYGLREKETSPSPSTSPLIKAHRISSSTGSGPSTEVVTPRRESVSSIHLPSTTEALSSSATSTCPASPTTRLTTKAPAPVEQSASNASTIKDRKHISQMDMTMGAIAAAEGFAPGSLPRWR